MPSLERRFQTVPFLSRPASNLQDFWAPVRGLANFANYACSAAEQHLVMTLPVENGRDLLKQVRTQLIEVARPALEALVQDITGIKPRSLHHDISTLTGEEVVIFTLAEAPQFRESRKK